MSYDLEVYSCLDASAELVAMMKRRELTRNGDAYALAGRNWQVVFSPPDKVEAEDIPPEVMRELPGIQYLVNINVEGEASDSTIAKAMSLAKKLAKAAHGVVVDQQADLVVTPKGVKRLDLGTAAKEQVPELHLVWWFENADALADEGCARLVDALETHAPEALPRRYGLWEPPQFKYAEKGRAHFLSFLREHLREPIVWYPSKPFLHVSIGVPPKVGGSPQGYRFGYFRLEVGARVLDSPGWAVGLRRTWLAVAEALSPFYAEIRLGESPVRAWFWNGVPHELGLAAMIGPPYDELWPDFIAKGEKVGSLTVMEALEGKKPLGLTPPKEIAQPGSLLSRGLFGIKRFANMTSETIQYPKTWPFAAPFA